MKAVYCYNKVDQITIEEVDRLAREPNSVVISSLYKMNLDYMISYLWKTLGMVRVYSKKPGQKPDMDGVVVTVLKCVHKKTGVCMRYCVHTHGYNDNGIRHTR